MGDYLAFRKMITPVFIQVQWEGRRTTIAWFLWPLSPVTTAA
jgi:hypothetical protein